MSDSLHVELLARGDILDVQEFIRAQWGQSHWTASDAVFGRFMGGRPVSWFDRTSSPDAVPVFAAVSKRGIEGLQVFYPFDLPHGDGTVRAALDLEWIGNPGFPGLGRRILNHTMALVDVLGGIGYGHVSLGAVIRGRPHIVLPEIPRLLVPVDHKEVNALGGAERSALWTAIDGSIPAPPPSGTEFDQVPAHEFAIGYPCRCTGAFCRCDVGRSPFSRSGAWLKWRFPEQSGSNYSALFRSSDRTHSVIFRNEMVRGESIVVSRILECFCSEACGYCGLRGLAALARLQGSALFDFICSDLSVVADMSRTLWDHGIGNYVNPDYPYLFQPLERRSGRSATVAFVLGDRSKGFVEADLMAMAANGFMRMTKADMDQDRV